MKESKKNNRVSNAVLGSLFVIMGILFIAE